MSSSTESKMELLLQTSEPSVPINGHGGRVYVPHFEKAEDDSLYKDRTEVRESGSVSDGSDASCLQRIDISAESVSNHVE